MRMRPLVPWKAARQAMASRMTQKMNWGTCVGRPPLICRMTRPPHSPCALQGRLTCVSGPATDTKRSLSGVPA